MTTFATIAAKIEIDHDEGVLTTDEYIDAIRALDEEKADYRWYSSYDYKNDYRI